MAKRKKSAKKSKKKSKSKKRKAKAPSKKMALPKPKPAVHITSSVKEYKPRYASLEHLKRGKSKYIVTGIWALIIAVILSVMLALVETPYLIIVLVAVGFIVGFLNFEHEETVKFLVATVSMLIIATALLLSGFTRLEIVAPVVALFLERASYNVISVVAPASFVIALKALRELAA